jgi:N utilization substance protein B
MSTGRRRARELVIQALYAWEIHQRDIDEIFDMLDIEPDLQEKHIEFARYLFSSVVEHVALLDEKISHLAANWKLERIAVIDRIILRIALCELLFMPDIPPKVIINEAVDLARLFSTNESSAFVNGILDAAVHSDVVQSHRRL